MRFYGFAPSEIIDATDSTGMLPLDVDPKLAWALKFRDRFPVDVNRAPRELLLRIPGLGVRAVDRIVASRRWRQLTLDDVARLARSIAKVRPFIAAAGWLPAGLTDRVDLPQRLRPVAKQLELFGA
jgi:predicted DNA-binding helix-hairpin-helix protein